MRTNIDIDDKLLKAAMKTMGTTTKKAAVETALRKVVQLKEQENIRRLFGKVQWKGDLAAMRRSDFLDEDGFHKQPAPEKKPIPAKRSRKPQARKPVAAA